MIFWGKAIYYAFALLDLQALFDLHLQNTLLFSFHLYQIPIRKSECGGAFKIKKRFRQFYDISFCKDIKSDQKGTFEMKKPAYYVWLRIFVKGKYLL